MPLNRLGDLIASTDSMPSTKQFEPPAQDSTFKSLKERIMEGNFSEPRSLISGFVNSASNNKRTFKTKNTFEYGKGDAVKAMAKFDLNLETVHEKVNDKSTIELINTKSLDTKQYDKLKQGLADAKVKKLVNGGIVQQVVSGQQTMKKALNNTVLKPGILNNARDGMVAYSSSKKNRGASVGSTQQMLETKKSFTSVA